ncbi:hypothetical protein E0H22_13365 [Rhodopseudomonas boonkerdii]|uniref:hypothetical protein n=1 Tax=Rhodopseudomonas boonkerdii TaxID=475937 RepID=UPI001E38F6A6|nr:hypothetical protein [Rhodopseudomonas boonkerdii]UGV26592.1 hypothetical protein E0H22_13365 [Rhodopseudomonas boonkerdii]
MAETSVLYDRFARFCAGRKQISPASVGERIVAFDGVGKSSDTAICKIVIFGDIGFGGTEIAKLKVGRNASSSLLLYCQAGARRSQWQ